MRFIHSHPNHAHRRGPRAESSGRRAACGAAGELDCAMWKSRACRATSWGAVSGCGGCRKGFSCAKPHAGAPSRPPPPFPPPPPPSPLPHPGALTSKSRFSSAEITGARLPSDAAAGPLAAAMTAAAADRGRVLLGRFVPTLAASAPGASSRTGAASAATAARGGAAVAAVMVGNGDAASLAVSARDRSAFSAARGSGPSRVTATAPPTARLVDSGVAPPTLTAKAAARAAAARAACFRSTDMAGTARQRRPGEP
jgi:hypothetical protein